MLRKLIATFGLALAFLAGSASASSHATPSRAATAVARVVAPDCRVGYYKNVDGICVHRPAHDPKGATAKCRDGTYSYSRHASGTCSHHGGVLRWIHHP